jgi:hypothetical protein
LPKLGMKLVMPQTFWDVLPKLLCLLHTFPTWKELPAAFDNTKA